MWFKKTRVTGSQMWLFKLKLKKWNKIKMSVSWLFNSHCFGQHFFIIAYSSGQHGPTDLSFSNPWICFLLSPSLCLECPSHFLCLIPTPPSTYSSNATYSGEVSPDHSCPSNCPDALVAQKHPGLRVSTRVNCRHQFSGPCHLPTHWRRSWCLQLLIPQDPA